MITDRHYVPILKGKEGEFKALEELFAADKSGLTPLVEIIPVPWDHENDQPAKSVADHLEPVARKLLGAWGTERPLFLDLDLLEEDDVGGEHPLSFVLQRTRAEGVPVVPVVGIGRSAAFIASVAEAVATDELGVCIRVTADDLTRGALVAELPALLGELECEIGSADLVLDYGHVTESNGPMLPMVIQAQIAALPQLGAWRSLTVAATGFPQYLTEVDAASTSTLPRVEWAVWLALRGMPLARRPAFGDYAIANPLLSEVDPRMLRMSASIRYTADTYWLILKGRNVRTYGFAQYHGLAAALVQRPEYSGAAFSWGDSYIEQCAAQMCGTGNATTWRKVGNNHHMTLVTSQIANLP